MRLLLSACPLLLSIACAPTRTPSGSEVKLTNPIPLSPEDLKHGLNFAMLEKGYKDCDAAQERYVIGSCGAVRIAEDLFVTSRHCLVDAKHRYLITRQSRWSAFLERHDIPHHAQGKCMEAHYLRNWAADADNGAIEVVAEYAPVPNIEVQLDNRTDVAILAIAGKDVDKVEQEITPISPEPPAIGTSVFLIGFGAAECIDTAGNFMSNKPYKKGAAENFSAGKGYFEVVAYDSLPGKMAVQYDPKYNHEGTVLIYAKGEQYICGGDSGGGIFTMDERRKYWLHSVVAAYYYSDATDPMEIQYPRVAGAGPYLRNQPFCDMVKTNGLRRPELEFCFQ